ncbi:MAG: hypothetical protein IPL69_20500 [Saprospiraceae bacterium]|nr:hypothetical protein [Candidatus Brachybacter algidus]
MISQQGGFTFLRPAGSCRNEAVDYTGKIETAREVLNQMFEGQVTYKQKEIMLFW